MSRSWVELVGHALDQAGQYRLRALERVAPDHARFATCLADGRRGRVDVFPAADATEAAQWSEQWELLRTWEHPHLNAIVDTGQMLWEDDIHVYVVTRRPDTDLGQVLENVNLTPEEARDVTASVLSGLAALHERGFAHRAIHAGAVLAVDAGTRLSPETITAADGHAMRDDMRAVGRLIVAMFGDCGFPLPDRALHRLAAACLSANPPTAEQALRSLTERPVEAGPNREYQRKVLLAVMTVVVTVVAVLALRVPAA